MASADVYWRRRFFTLAAGLGVLGVLVWALSGMTGGHQPPGAGGGADGQAPAAYRSPASGTAAKSAAANTGGSSTPARAATRQTTAPTTASQASAATPAGTGSVSGRGRTPGTATAAATPGAGSTGPATGRGKPGGSGAVGPGGRCAGGAVVLSLATATTSYTAGQTPTFRVDVVSTEAAACSYDVGPAALTLTVRSQTGVSWQSNACVRKPAAKTVTLHRGIPEVVTVRWNRTLSVDGCGKGAAVARPGRYQAVARDGATVSRPQPFLLH